MYCQITGRAQLDWGRGGDEEAQNLLQDSRILQTLRVSRSPAAVPQPRPGPLPPHLVGASAAWTG